LFVIGAQRSGTTYLWKVLEAHPEVCMAKPMRPEPKYFLSESSVAAGYQLYLEQFFLGQTGFTWFGEKSTSYLESWEAADRIKNVVTDPTIIVMLRDPIERAISNYLFSKENGLESRDIKSALLSDTKNRETVSGVSVSPFAYISRGQYLRDIEQWEDRFGAEKILIMVFEEFIGNVQAIQELYSKLKIDDSVVVKDIAETVNASTRGEEVELIYEIRNELESLFQPWNEKLAARYDLDLASWGGMT